MKTGKRIIKDGHQYERFFKNANGKNITVKKEALLEDTIKWLKIVVAKTLNQTEKIANHLQASRVRETCNRIWNFCFHHFQYEKDEQRKEQIRTPNRAWMDRHNHIGIDCDCFTVTICSILENLKIPYVMRITRYKSEEFEHIYPVAFTPEGQEVVIDCVVHEFDYEVPYTEKKDIEMELQILNGVEDERFNEFGDKISFEHDLPIDAEDLFLDDDMELEGLEGRAERKARQAARKAKRNRPKSVKKAERKANRKKFIDDFKKGNLKDKLRAGFHVLNKANPASLLLRGGILASMKINLFKVASRLRFAYWSAAQARANSMDMGKYNQLQRIREKIEKIYFRAGGKPEKLKQAILTGKGNRNKMVSLNGLGSITQLPSDEDSLIDILGEDLFFEELNGFEGLQGLGEPATIATGAAITAASGAVGIIAGLLKKVGGLFKKGTKAAQQFKIQDNTDNKEERTRKFSFKNIANNIRNKVQERRSRKGNGMTQGSERIDIPDDEFANDLPEEDFEISPEDEFVMDDPFDPSSNRTQGGEIDPFEENGDDGEGKKGFGQWVSDNKVGVGIGAGLLVAGTAVTIYLVKKSKKAAELAKKNSKPVNGISNSKKKPSKKSAANKSKKFVPRSRGRKKPNSGAPKIEPIM